MYSASKLIPVFVPLFCSTHVFQILSSPQWIVLIFIPALGAWHCALALQISQNAQIGRTVGILGVVVKPTPAGLASIQGDPEVHWMMLKQSQLFMVML
jgi:hypothetical protein